MAVDVEIQPKVRKTRRQELVTERDAFAQRRRRHEAIADESMSRDAAGQTALETRSGIAGELDRAQENGARIMPRHPDIGRTETIAGQAQALSQQRGQAAGRERVCPYV